jgi:microcystin-dependent protein
MRREVLRVGLLGLLSALFGIVRARAAGADALTIDPDGAAHFSGPVTIHGNNTLVFGAGVEGKQVDAGKIGYQTFTADALDIVGAGKTPQRKIKFWAEGGATLAGDLTVSGTVAGKGAVPVGAILMWSGNPANLPAGWVLCDGTNNTPNLQDRFVVGYNAKNPDYNGVGKTGGEAAHILTIAEMPPHNHGQAGQHDHTFQITGHGWAFAVAQSGDPDQRDNGGGSARTNLAGAHTHAVEGGGGPHENRPPYYVLAYIMFGG